jgi:hypothetical protein
MTLAIQNVGDNPWVPVSAATVYLPDQLIAGKNLITQPIVLGAGTLPRGSVLGQQTSFSIIATPNGAGVNGANTGTGTVGSYVYESNDQFGNFIVAFTSATAFTVTDPEGNSLGTGTTGTAFVGTPASGTAEVGFTITAGGTAFVACDGFLLNSQQAQGTYILSVRTASDGSQNPSAILADYADASAGAVSTGAYLAGEFNQNAINFDTSWTLPQLVSAMRVYGLFAKFATSAVPPD